MSRIDKYFGGNNQRIHYDYKNKEQNVSNYVAYMVNRSLAMFKWHNLPDTIPQEELEKILQCGGMVTWYKHTDGNLYVFDAALGGEADVYNRPTKAVITSSALKLSVECEIDKDCVVMLNDSMAMGLLPLYEKYCYIINETDITMILATVNKRIQILLSANDDNTVASAKRFISDIESGKLGVIAETKLFDSLKVNNSSTNNNQSLKDIFELQMYLKASLFNEIGLGAVQNSKKEQLTISEVETNSDNLYPLVDDMLSSRRKALDKINEMFGTDIQVEFNSSWDYRIYNGEQIDSIPDDETSVKQAELETGDGENVGTPETGGITEQSTESEQVQVDDEQPAEQADNDASTSDEQEEKEEQEESEIGGISVQGHPKDSRPKQVEDEETDKEQEEADTENKEESEDKEDES